jgi:hypothetical protein
VLASSISELKWELAVGAVLPKTWVEAGQPLRVGYAETRSFRWFG